MIRLALLLFIFLLAQTGPLLAELATPEPAAPLFQDRPFGPRPEPTDTRAARKINPEDDKPIPLGWIIGGACVAAIAIGLLLFGSARRWRSSNLFDRQYRFPVDPNPALRFGGKKCGGHLAQVQFGSAVKSAAQSSKTKDT